MYDIYHLNKHGNRIRQGTVRIEGGAYPVSACGYIFDGDANLSISEVSPAHSNVLIAIVWCTQQGYDCYDYSRPTVLIDRNSELAQNTATKNSYYVSLVTWDGDRSHVDLPESLHNGRITTTIDPGFPVDRDGMFIDE